MGQKKSGRASLDWFRFQTWAHALDRGIDNGHAPTVAEISAYNEALHRG